MYALMVRGFGLKCQPQMALGYYRLNLCHSKSGAEGLILLSGGGGHLVDAASGGFPAVSSAGGTGGVEAALLGVQTEAFPGRQPYGVLHPTCHLPPALGPHTLRTGLWHASAVCNTGLGTRNLVLDRET